MDDPIVSFSIHKSKSVPGVIRIFLVHQGGKRQRIAVWTTLFDKDRCFIMLPNRDLYAGSIPVSLLVAEFKKALEVVCPA